MFTLRTCFSEGSERNNYLGDDYKIFYKSEKDLEDEFNYYFNVLSPKPEKNDINSVVAIINNDNMLIPLYRQHTYYIMTEKGKTFSKLSWSNETK